MKSAQSLLTFYVVNPITPIWGWCLPPIYFVILGMVYGCLWHKVNPALLTSSETFGTDLSMGTFNLTLRGVFVAMATKETPMAAAMATHMETPTAIPMAILMAIHMAAIALDFSGFPHGKPQTNWWALRVIWTTWSFNLGCFVPDGCSTILSFRDLPCVDAGMPHGLRKLWRLQQSIRLFRAWIRRAAVRLLQ